MSRIRLGYWDNSFKETLWYPTGEAHGLLCGGVRKGKTRDVLFQMLTSFKGSIFVVDPKLQLASISARFIQDVLKHDVYILNPFNVLPKYLKRFKHARYDPLRSNLDPQSDSFSADADNLMEGICPYGGPEPHWVDSSRMLGAGIAMRLREAYPKATLASLQRIVSGPQLIEFCKAAVANTKDDFCASKLGRFIDDAALENREIRSIISTLTTQLGFLGNKPIADNMSESTIDYRQMRERPIAVFLGLAGKHQANCAKWNRVIVNSWADACLQEGRGKVPILGVLDEFKTSVGKLGSVETLLGMGAGYGCQLVPVIRDLPELQELYPKGWESWVANAGFQLWFGCRDWTTSEYLSRMTGTMEVHTVSKSFNKTESISTGSQGKRYLAPEEIRELPDDEMLAWIDGVPGVIRAGKRPYYCEGSEFGGMYDPDPYHS